MDATLAAMAETSLQLVGGASARRKSTPAGDEAAPGSGWLTIEQLAEEIGMTVRNVRAHQAKGLLPPPEVRQRIGYYGPEHVARLRLVRELRAEGFNLRGIKHLLERTHGPAEGLLDLKRAVSAPFETEQPQVFTREELAVRLGSEVGPRNLAKAQRLGILVPLGGGRYEAPSPSLLDAAEEVMSRGVSLRAALAVVEDVQRSCQAVARRFTKLFLEDVWKPFEQAGQPEDRLNEVVEAIERLRPIASQVITAVFQQTMSREVEKGFGKELARLSEGRRR
jgi:DNA-binding transcriptional MerR regulator